VPEGPITRPVTQPQFNKNEEVGSLPEYEQAEVDTTAKTESHSLDDSARPLPLVFKTYSKISLKTSVRGHLNQILLHIHVLLPFESIIKQLFRMCY
jgi:hypothetical protein